MSETKRSVREEPTTTGVETQRRVNVAVLARNIIMIKLYNYSPESI